VKLNSKKTTRKNMMNNNKKQELDMVENQDKKIDFEQQIYEGNRFDYLYDMMKCKIKEVLVISSLYDDFIIAEDGTYSDMLFEQYNELNLSTPPPRLTRVSNAQDALLIYKEKPFDLVITMTRLVGMNPFELGQKLKKIRPEIPVILLLTSNSDTAILPPFDEREGVDQIYLFNGDSEIFLAIIKQIEDRLNIEKDTMIGKVRVIVVVEDSIQFYSIFLPLIYKEIMVQTRLLIEQGLNHNHKLVLMRGRPKIILTQTFEEAKEYIDKYKEYLLTVISDIAFPKNGIKDFNAGYEIVNHVRGINPYMPILLQSSDKINKKKAEELNVDFIHKHSLSLLQKVRKYFDGALGFGDFEFRMEDRSEIARATTVEELSRMIIDIPDESIMYHSERNHFSNWLFCRAEFSLASELQKITADEFSSTHDIKKFLQQFFFERVYLDTKRGLVTEFSESRFRLEEFFVRVGKGSLGGKGRGLAFINKTFNLKKISKKYENTTISVPNTIFISTQYFDKFMKNHNLYDRVLEENLSDDEVKDLFLSKSLPNELKDMINFVAKIITEPIAVRSSSLLEDSQFQPFAGIYNSYMLPNLNKRLKLRANHICDAIKLVYASAYYQNARSYVSSVGEKLEVEKMAVIIQPISGKKINSKFYPTLSGVARSYNYYPIGPMQKEDGIVYLALGHGAIITSGRKVLSYCPKYPKYLPFQGSIDLTMDSTQNNFLALDFESTDIDLRNGEEATLSRYDLQTAKDDKILKWLGSVYDVQNDILRDGIARQGPIVINFPFILKYNKIPITDIIIDLLDIGKTAFGCEVEIEFAVNIDYEEEKRHKFEILQIRPLVTDTNVIDEDITKYKDEAVMYSDKVLGNGIYEDFYDIIYVRPDDFNRTQTYDIQLEIQKLNTKLGEEDKKYLLIGPGRWGTSDRFLGIPVNWHEINNAGAIAEVALEDFQIDPSSGQHFFLNITSTKKPYFTIPFKDEEAFINWEWFNNQEIVSKGDFVSHIKLDEPLKILINGQFGLGAIIVDK
jgi:CheY-like chemotaxis protein